MQIITHTHTHPPSHADEKNKKNKKKKRVRKEVQEPGNSGVKRQRKKTSDRSFPGSTKAKHQNIYVQRLAGCLPPIITKRGRQRTERGHHGHIAGSSLSLRAQPPLYAVHRDTPTLLFFKVNMVLNVK